MAAGIDGFERIESTLDLRSNPFGESAGAL
jgi:hypothetical protein